MFESAELGNSITKATYKKEALLVRQTLLDLQHEMARSNTSLIVIIAGFEGAGKGETVNLLLEWMDARGIETHAMDKPTDEERDRPPMWRFWRRLPPTGRTAIFVGGWYQELILKRVRKKSSREDFTLVLEHIEDFERMLSRERTLLVKFWLHMSKESQKGRFKKLEADPHTRWRVTKEDWKLHKRYDAIRRYAEQALRKTNIADAAWHIIEAEDKRYRHLTVAKTLVQALQHRLDRSGPQAPLSLAKFSLPVPKPNNILARLNLTLRLPEKEYEKRLQQAQATLHFLLARWPRPAVIH